MSTAPKEYQFAVIATDAVVFAVIDGELNVLLMDINRPPHYKNILGVPGGLIQVHETADDTVKRLLKEKCNAKDYYFEQLYTFSALKRDPRNRVVSVAYLVLMNNNQANLKHLEGTKWVPLSELPKLAFDHNDIVETAMERLRAKFEYTNIAMHLLPRHFTLTELQEVYELILGYSLDKRNFRKKILSLGLVKETGKKQEGVSNRPALLYTFTSLKLKTLPVIG